MRSMISAAAVTVSASTGLVTPFSAAVMFVVPTARVDARPDVLIVATDGVADVQTTWLVRVGGRVVGVGPRRRELLGQALGHARRHRRQPRSTSMPPAVTVRVSTGLVIPSSDAVMLVVPTARVDARPDVLIVATDGVADAQVTWLVRLAVVPSV